MRKTDLLVPTTQLLAHPSSSDTVKAEMPTPPAKPPAKRMSSRLTIGQEKKSNIIEISDSEDETFKWIENDCSEVIEISDDDEEEPIQSGKQQQRKAIGPSKKVSEVIQISDEDEGLIRSGKRRQRKAIGPRKKVCHPKVVKDDWVY